MDSRAGFWFYWVDAAGSVRRCPASTSPTAQGERRFSLVRRVAHWRVPAAWLLAARRRWRPRHEARRRPTTRLPAAWRFFAIRTPRRRPACRAAAASLLAAHGQHAWWRSSERGCGGTSAPEPAAQRRSALLSRNTAALALRGNDGQRLALQVAGSSGVATCYFTQLRPLIDIRLPKRSKWNQSIPQHWR
jgi:hypothetical protein